MNLKDIAKPLGLPIWFNLAWAACVFGPAWMAPVCMMIWVMVAYSTKSSFSAICLVFLGGLLMDGLFIWTGVYQFSSSTLPFWLVVLWLGFAVSLILSLNMLTQKLGGWLVPTLTLLAPLSYWVGSVTDKLHWLLGNWQTFVISCCGWLVFSMLIHKLLVKQQTISVSLVSAGVPHEK